MADELSFQDFQVDLAAMATVIGQVKAEAGNIEAAMAEIKRQFAAAETAWRSPSGYTFAELGSWFDSCQSELSNVLSDMAARLEAAHATYHEMEQTVLGTLNYTTAGGGQAPDDASYKSDHDTAAEPALSRLTAREPAGGN